MVELSGCPVAKSTTRAAFLVKRILWPIEILVQSRLLGRRARVWSRRDAGRPRGGSCKLKSGLGKTPRCVIARIAGSRVYRRAATGKHPPGPKAFSIIGSLSVDGSQCFLRCFSVRPVYSAFQRVEFSEVFSLPFLHVFPPHTDFIHGTFNRLGNSARPISEETRRSRIDRNAASFEISLAVGRKYKKLEEAVVADKI